MTKIQYEQHSLYGWYGSTEDGQQAVGRTKPEVRRKLQAGRSAHIATVRASEELQDLRRLDGLAEKRLSPGRKPSPPYQGPWNFPAPTLEGWGKALADWREKV